MKDLHIVIVSWNARDLLERCLRSLPAACDGLNWECIVVDNNSADGSANMVKETFADEERIDLITNTLNIGFSRACNQGAVQHKSRNVLLLNVDTECPAGSLTRLVREMDAKTEVGIMGPKILNPDGTLQPSVRRFPGMCDQVATMLKLQKVLPDLPCFKRYFHDDLETEKAQEVDQVMGACFLVKAALWDRMHGLDQRYFFWFEEVDACKQAKELGFKIWYEPSVQVMHHRGAAVAKTDAVRRQSYFNDSLRKYMFKWHGLTAWLVFVALSPIATLLAAGVGFGRRVSRAHSNKTPWWARLKNLRLACYALHRLTAMWLLIATGLWAVSAVTIHNTQASAAFLIALTAITFLMSLFKPAYGLSLVVLELGIGGFGRMASVEVGWLDLSLRMALMGGFFMGWGLNALKARVWRFWRWSEFVIIQVWPVVAGMVILGIFRGWQLEQPFIFQDANSWFFLLYLIPVLDVAHRFGYDLKRLTRSALLAGVIINGVMALATLYVFTHGFAMADVWYTWVRDARLGEITPAGGGLVRVFFQSFIFSIIALIGVMAIWYQHAYRQPLDVVARGISWKFLEKPNFAVRSLIPGIGVLSAVTIALSLSRSFWLGLAAGGMAVLVFGLVKFRSLKFFTIIRMFMVLVGGLVLIFLVMIAPPQKAAWSVTDYFAERGSVSDPAAASRWSLLPVMLEDIKNNPVVGHGLGNTLTFKSSDPRVLKAHPDGMQTTYAFEWGWLSLWDKFGLFGVGVMLWLLVSIGWRLWKSDYEWWFRVSGIASILALAVIHFFTPYLDHPLGFAWLLGVEGALAIKRPNPLWNPNK